MTRREWLALIAATPLLKADTAPAPVAPVSIAKCPSYDDVTGKLDTMFDQLGGLSKLVRNKTVGIKLNLTGGPGMRVNGLDPGRTHMVHPKVVAATVFLMGRAGAKRVRILESAWGPRRLEDSMQASGFDVKGLQSILSGVEFENTNILGQAKQYSRFKVPNPYMYAEYVLNHSYEDTDVFVSMAKLKNHADCGVTLSMKNCFGMTPISIYGDDAGVDEPNERARQGGRPWSTRGAGSRRRSLRRNCTPASAIRPVTASRAWWRTWRWRGPSTWPSSMAWNPWPAAKGRGSAANYGL